MRIIKLIEKDLQHLNGVGYLEQLAKASYCQIYDVLFIKLVVVDEDSEFIEQV